MSVVVMGSLHWDLMVDAPALPRLGETAVGSAWAHKPGGKGGNQAVAAARHGAAVAMFGLVGADDFGQRLREHLRVHGVDESGVLIRAGADSGISVAITERSGDYGAVIVSGVNQLIDEAVLAPAAGRLAACSVLLLQNEVPDPANMFAARMARDCGAQVLLNAAPARALPGPLEQVLDILVVNALEAEALCGHPVDGLAAAERAAAALAGRVPYAVVTVGGAGLALAGRDGVRLLVPAHTVRVVSTHGAGDAFVGALAARLDAGEKLADAVRYANAAAALAVSRPDKDQARIGRNDVLGLLQPNAGAG